LHHPLVGDLTLSYEALESPGDAGQRILIYTAESSTPTQEALNLLGIWATAPSPEVFHPNTLNKRAMEKQEH
jgi:hypothetical protein